MASGGEEVMSESPPWMTAADDEPAFHKQLRSAFNKLSMNGCTLSPNEFFPVAFGIFLVGSIGGASSQNDYAKACAERALGLAVDFTPFA
jgi:hypothetical protein